MEISGGDDSAEPVLSKNSSMSKNSSSREIPRNVTARVKSNVKHSTSSDGDSEARASPDVSVYQAERIVGQGAFGAVYLAKAANSDKRVAIKKVHQDPKFINRELHIMKKISKYPHPCVLLLMQYFVTSENEGDKYLNLVFEYVPETLHSIAKKYNATVGSTPLLHIKLYMYQLARAMAHIHGLGVTHRDLKLQNVLVDEKTFSLKLCDFGSAKPLIVGEANVAYICSRHYRAPELIFEATAYTTAIDVWSLGCVMGELLLGRPVFPGSSAVDQLVEVIQVMGSPTDEQMTAMNPNYQSKKFPQLPATPLKDIFPTTTPPEAVALLEKLFEYTPNNRPKSIEVCAFSLFNCLRKPGSLLPSGEPLPANYFQFTDKELCLSPEVQSQLLPAHLASGFGTNEDVAIAGEDAVATTLPDIKRGNSRRSLASRSSGGSLPQFPTTEAVPDISLLSVSVPADASASAAGSEKVLV